MDGGSDDPGYWRNMRVNRLYRKKAGIFPEKAGFRPMLQRGFLL